MKKLNVLKMLLDVFYFFSLLGVVLLMIFASMIIIYDQSFPIKIKGNEIIAADLAGKLLIGCVLMSFLCFVYAIFLLRKVVSHFVKREIFHDRVIFFLNRIGILLIVSVALQDIPLFFYGMFHRSEVEFEFTSGGFDSFLLGIGLGLFFMVLSEVFKIAKTFKEDSELAV